LLNSTDNNIITHNYAVYTFLKLLQKLTADKYW